MSVGGGPDRAHEDMTADCDQPIKSVHASLSPHLRQLTDEAQWWVVRVAIPCGAHDAYSSTGALILIGAACKFAILATTTGLNDRWLHGAGCGIVTDCFIMIHSH